MDYIAIVVSGLVGILKTALVFIAPLVMLGVLFFFCVVVIRLLSKK